MNSLVLGGAILALAGLLGIAVPYFTADHSREVARIGDLKINATETTAYHVPPLFAGGALGLGIIVLGAGLYRKT